VSAASGGAALARRAIEDIRALAAGRRVRVMNVCGGHERTIAHSGLRGALAESVELIPGPGCPVCVCPEEDIYLAIQIARRGAVVCAFGDMLRVPANVPRGEPRSLEQARAAGADVVPVASPQAAWQLARQRPGRDVVFFAAGFETTMAPVAATLAAARAPDNLSLLVSGRRTWPAVAALLAAAELGRGEAGFDALVAPGHVATVMGASEWRFVPERYGIPTAIAGFSPLELVSATRAALTQWRARRPSLDNCYAEAVLADGNPTARRVLDEVFVIRDASWRGIGSIAASGYELSAPYGHLDARARHAELADDTRRRIGQMPPGCACADVVLGKRRPTGCPLYGARCTPSDPVGPCMVSDEGACRIWWASGVRERERGGADAGHRA
jgi:hydrogenase expression/formation protein HypD